MSPKNYLFRLFGVFLIVTPLFLGGCSYLPWMADDDEEDLAFEEDFPFEDEQPARSAGGDGGEDDFFAEDGALIEGGGDFSSTEQSADSSALQGDVESLQSQQEALISKVRELEEILLTLEPKVSAAQERLEGSLASATQSQFLEPEVDELKIKVNQLNEEINRLKMARAGASSPRAHSKSSVIRPSKGTPPQYNKALKAYQAGNYDESILLFQNFALSNPPGHLKDNILFWIGSNYVKLEMYENAIKQFDTVLNQFPNSNKSHDSRLMLGVSYYKKGEASRAIDVLETALKYNPPSDVKGKILAQLGEIQ